MKREDTNHIPRQALYLDEVYPQDAWELRPTPKEVNEIHRPEATEGY